MSGEIAGLRARRCFHELVRGRFISWQDGLEGVNSGRWLGATGAGLETRRTEAAGLKGTEEDFGVRGSSVAAAQAGAH